MNEHIQKNRGKIKSRSLPWFRFYTEAIDDPKVQRLPAHLFKTWVNLLCLAGQSGGKLPSIDDIAFRLRLSAQEAEGHLSELILVGLIDITENGREPHNWSTRQFQSDSSTERVKKHRKLKDETPCNVSETASVTTPEQNRADSEQIQTRAESIPATAPSADPDGRTDPDFVECKSAFNGSTESMIATIESAMGGHCRQNATEWLANLVRINGQRAVAEAYQRFLTAKAEGSIIARPLKWLDTTAKDCGSKAQPKTNRKLTVREIFAMEAAGEITI